MDTRPTAAPRWQRRPEARPEEILDAAQAIFSDQGFARAKLDDVARRAGVSKGTLYLYFDSKETLFREMVRAKIVSQVIAKEELVRTYVGTSEDLLKVLLRQMWESVRRPDMAGISRLMQSELGNFPDLARFYLDEVVLRARRLMQAVLDRGVASGEFRRVPHEFATRAVLSLLVHSSQFQCFFSNIDPEPLTDEQVFEGISDLVLYGLLTRPDHAKA